MVLKILFLEGTLGTLEFSRTEVRPISPRNPNRYRPLWTIIYGANNE